MSKEFIELYKSNTAHIKLLKEMCATSPGKWDEGIVLAKNALKVIKKTADHMHVTIPYEGALAYHLDLLDKDSNMSPMDVTIGKLISLQACFELLTENAAKA